MHFSDEDVPDKVSAFLGKLLNMIQDPKTDNLITWSKMGTSFIITNQLEFTKELLPKYYKHNNMASFIRQLNMYGFHKVISTSAGGLKSESDAVEFLHPYFVKGRPELIQNIKRKINIPRESNVEPSRSSFMYADSIKKLITDVRDLRGKQQNLDLQLGSVKQENEILWRELSILRHKHATQQHIVNKLIRFLVSLAHPSNSTVVKRKILPPMIKDSRVSTPMEREYQKQDVASSSRSPGPTIHEIYPSDILDNVHVIEAPVMEVSTTSDIDNEFVTSPDSMLNSSEYNNASPESGQMFQSEVGSPIYVQAPAISPISVNSVGSRESIHASSPSPHLTPSVSSHSRASPVNYVLNEDPKNNLLDLLEETDPEEEYITIYLDPNDVEPPRISSPINPNIKSKFPVKRKGGRGRGKNSNDLRLAQGKVESARSGRKRKNDQRSAYITPQTPVVIKNPNNGTDEYILGLTNMDDQESILELKDSNNSQKPVKTFVLVPTAENATAFSKVTSSSRAVSAPKSNSQTTLIQNKSKQQVTPAVKSARSSIKPQIANSNVLSNLVTIENLSTDNSLLNYITDSENVNTNIDAEVANSCDVKNSAFNNNINFNMKSNVGNANNCLFSNNEASNAADMNMETQATLGNLNTLLNIQGNSLTTNENVPLVNMGYNSGLNLNTVDLFSNTGNKSNTPSLNKADPLTLEKITPTAGTSNQESNMKIACPDSYGVSGKLSKSYINDINSHLESVQTDLENLREVMKREGISLDYSTMLGLFNEDPVSYNMPPEGHLFENKLKSEGNELVSCSSPLNEFMDFNDWVNWSLPNTPQPENSASNDSYCNLNTPQIEPRYLNQPSPSKTKSS